MCYYNRIFYLYDFEKRLDMRKTKYIILGVILYMILNIILISILLTMLKHK